jgi:hypothetical protein
MHGFTALPQPLRWYMGCWAKEMNERLKISIKGNGTYFSRMTMKS